MSYLVAVANSWGQRPLSYGPITYEQHILANTYKMSDEHWVRWLDMPRAWIVEGFDAFGLLPHQMPGRLRVPEHHGGYGLWQMTPNRLHGHGQAARPRRERARRTLRRAAPRPALLVVARAMSVTEHEQVRENA